MKNKKAPNDSFCYNIFWRLCLPISNLALGGEHMLDLFLLLWSSVLAPLLVNAVSYVLKKLFDQRLDNGHSKRRKNARLGFKRHQKRR